MEQVDLGQAFEDHMVAAINRLTAPRSEWPGFKEALRHQIARQKVALTFAYPLLSGLAHNPKIH